MPWLVFSDEFLSIPRGGIGGVAPATGLTFPSNGTPGSDIRLVFTGANLLPRVGHTALWKIRYVQQNGYYAVTWHTVNDGEWHGFYYEFGAHPYPSTGAVDATGASTGGFGDGNTHHHEIAGLHANDFLAAPGGSAVQVTKGIWYTQARITQYVTITTTNDTIRHIFYPDIDGNPGFTIQQDVAASLLESPSAPAFYWGCSEWTGNGDANQECTSGILRYLKLFDAALSFTEIQLEAGSNTDGSLSDAGSAAKWYSCINPTPTDITDKSGAGHTPAWANSNRPTLWP